MAVLSHPCTPVPFRPHSHPYLAFVGHALGVEADAEADVVGVLHLLAEELLLACPGELQALVALWR